MGPGGLRIRGIRPKKASSRAWGSLSFCRRLKANARATEERVPRLEGVAETPMLTSLTTNFVGRLKRNDEAAWFELWETFGPVIRGQLTKWGRGRIGSQTVQDLSQGTLAGLSDSIERYDPSSGARFSTWLRSVAQHVLGDRMDRAERPKP